MSPSPQLLMTSLSGRESDNHVLSILKAAVGAPTPEKLRALAEEYQESARRHLFGLVLDQDLQCLIGVEQINETELRIRHIATSQAERNRGYGRTLIERVLSQFKADTIWAETDDDAVGFYRRCGFNVESLGEQYPGVNRYRCTLRADTD